MHLWRNESVQLTTFMHKREGSGNVDDDGLFHDAGFASSGGDSPSYESSIQLVHLDTKQGPAVVSVDPSASLFICGADVLPVFSFFDSKIVK